jgi:hypothetical protein
MATAMATAKAMGTAIAMVTAMAMGRATATVTAMAMKTVIVTETNIGNGYGEHTAAFQCHNIKLVTTTRIGHQTTPRCKPIVCLDMSFAAQRFLFLFILAILGVAGTTQRTYV